jgi:predicted Zn-dependent protease
MEFGNPMSPILRKAALAAAALVLLGCSASPTGESTLLLNSPEQMNTLGRQSFEQLKANTPVEDDPALNAYVSCVAHAVLDQVPAQYGYGADDWEVVVFKDEAINAFALPGAKIGVYTGMLKTAQNQDQLAAVLGHEVAHVLAQHGNARMSQQQLTQIGLGITTILLTDRVETRTQKMLVGALGLGAQFGVLLPYSRSHEQEADVMGQEIMANAGFNPTEAAELWRVMAQQGGAQPPEFMSTHPSQSRRIDMLSQRAPALMPLYRQAQAAGFKPQCERLRR